jgi:CRP-like cAMP-binding protein
LTVIYNYLRKLDVFQCLHDAPLKSVCRTARLERHIANHVLFRKGQVATCWYILLSGCVFMNKQVYLPVGCFGKRNGMNLRRGSDCIVIQPSEMIVIDYPDVQRIPVHHNGMPAMYQQPRTSQEAQLFSATTTYALPTTAAETTTTPFVHCDWILFLPALCGRSKYSPSAAVAESRKFRR